MEPDADLPAKGGDAFPQRRMGVVRVRLAALQFLRQLLADGFFNGPGMDKAVEALRQRGTEPRLQNRRAFIAPIEVEDGTSAVNGSQSGLGCCAGCIMIPQFASPAHFCYGTGRPEARVE